MQCPNRDSCVSFRVCVWVDTSGWRTRSRWSLGRCCHSSFTVFSWASLHTRISWLPEAVLRARNWEMMWTIGLEAREQTHCSLLVRVYNKLKGSAGIQPKPFSWNTLCCESWADTPSGTKGCLSPYSLNVHTDFLLWIYYPLDPNTL